jgi:predicted aspartyl protease
MHYDGEAGAAWVIFGDEDDPPIMGVTAMETMGFEADPGSGKLKHVEILML